MNTFVNTLSRTPNRVLTENAGVTFDSSTDAVVDLFFAIGALRGQAPGRLYRLFSKAVGQNRELAARVAMWARDARGGAGERQIFRDLLVWLEKNDPVLLAVIGPKIPELGRWDDLLVFKTKRFKDCAFEMIADALNVGDGLCAKWMPRKGQVANELRRYLKLTPKAYRKLLVNSTNVVETKMCAKSWADINYEHVPSVAQSRYNAAFLRHDETRYRGFMEKAVKGEVKVNASAVFPYDVLKPVIEDLSVYRFGEDLSVNRFRKINAFDPNTVRAQWANLPDYMGDDNVLPLVDTSGSMTCGIPGSNLTPQMVALSLGLYMATKNKGAFKNLFMTFSKNPEFVKLTGSNIVTQVEQMNKANWDMNTNVFAALKKIASFGRENDIPQKDMPKSLVIFSDMEFDRVGKGLSYNNSSRETTYEAAKTMFEEYGYETPNIIWWNIQSRQDNVPVKFDQSGTALVSGFSPSVAKNIMSGKDITPRVIMMETIMNPRYDLILG